MDIREQRTLFSEILKGYSYIFFDNQKLVVKHPNYNLIAETDSLYKGFYEQAIKNKIPAEKEKLETLKKNGQWDEKYEKALLESIEMIRGLETTKKTLFLESQIEEFNKQIRKEEANYKSILLRKMKLLGLTAEAYTHNKINGEYLFQSVYLNEQPFFTRKKFENLDEEEYRELEEKYNEVKNRFNVRNVQILALSHFIQNLFYLSNDSIWDFYGKPVVDLTIYQEELLKYCRYFKNILSQQEIPDEMRSDPEKVIESYVTGKNLQEIVEKSKDAKNLSIPGAKSKDLKKVGIENSRIGDLVGKIKKDGKSGVNLKDI